MKVKDVCIINPKPRTKRGNWINYIDTSSVNDGELVAMTKLVGEFPSRAQRELFLDDILISSVRPNLKHNYYVSIDKPNLVGSSGFIQVRAKPNKIVPKFLYYFLTSQPRIDQYTTVANLAQTAFPSFNKDLIEELELPALSMDEQRHIVDAIASLLRESS